MKFKVIFFEFVFYYGEGNIWWFVGFYDLKVVVNICKKYEK